MNGWRAPRPLPSMTSPPTTIVTRTTNGTTAAYESEDPEAEQPTDRDVDTCGGLDGHGHPPHREVPLMQLQRWGCIHDPERLSEVLAGDPESAEPEERGREIDLGHHTIAARGVRRQGLRGSARRDEVLGWEEIVPDREDDGMEIVLVRGHLG